MHHHVRHANLSPLWPRHANVQTEWEVDEDGTLLPTWYKGRVMRYEAASPFPFYVKYEDGDKEWVMFADTLDSYTVREGGECVVRNIRWLDVPPSPSRNEPEKRTRGRPPKKAGLHDMGSPTSKAHTKQSRSGTPKAQRQGAYSSDSAYASPGGAVAAHADSQPAPSKPRSEAGMQEDAHGEHAGTHVANTQLPDEPKNAKVENATIQAAFKAAAAAAAAAVGASTVESPPGPGSRLSGVERGNNGAPTLDSCTARQETPPGGTQEPQSEKPSAGGGHTSAVPAYAQQDSSKQRTKVEEAQLNTQQAGDSKQDIRVDVAQVLTQPSRDHQHDSQADGSHAHSEQASDVKHVEGGKGAGKQEEAHVRKEHDRDAKQAGGSEQGGEPDEVPVHTGQDTDNMGGATLTKDGQRAGGGMDGGVGGDAGRAGGDAGRAGGGLDRAGSGMAKPAVDAAGSTCGARRKGEAGAQLPRAASKPAPEQPEKPGAPAAGRRAAGSRPRPTGRSGSPPHKQPAGGKLSVGTTQPIAAGKRWGSSEGC